MRYVKYLSKGNTQGLEQNIESYWEIDREGHFSRSIEKLEDGTLLKYSEEREADSFGQLPEGKVTEENLTDNTFGIIVNLTKNEFEAVWVQEALNQRK